jgi:hypothetical protein
MQSRLEAQKVSPAAYHAMLESMRNGTGSDSMCRIKPCTDPLTAGQAIGSRSVSCIKLRLPSCTRRT